MKDAYQSNEGHSENLTNEHLTRRFESSFSLCNRAITLAKGMIELGRPALVDSAFENPANIVLAEIAAGKDAYALELAAERKASVVQENMVQKTIQLVRADLKGFDDDEDEVQEKHVFDASASDAFSEYVPEEKE